MKQRSMVLALLLLAGCVHGARGQAYGQSADLEPAGQPVTLTEAVEIALKNNPAIAASSSYAEAVRQGIATAEAARYPKLDFTEGFTRGNNPVYVFGTLLTQQRFTADDFALNSLNRPHALDNFATQFSGSVPLWDGEISHKVKDAKLAERTARQQQARTQQEVIFRAVEAYTRELLAREDLGVAESAVRATQSVLHDAQARGNAGTAIPSDLLIAQVHLAETKEDLLSTKDAVSLARARLNVALGLPEDAPTVLGGQLDQVEFDSGTLDRQQQIALKQRPDYIAAELAIEQAKNNTGLAHAAFQPKLSLFGTWEADSETFAAGGGNNWGAGARLTFNIFNGGAKFAQVRAARAMEQQANALEAGLNATIRLEVEQAYRDLATAKARMTVAAGAVSSAEAGLRVLENRYKAGLATMTDVLQADTARSRAKRSYFNALYGYRLSEAALELATGDLSAGSPAVVK